MERAYGDVGRSGSGLPCNRVGSNHRCPHDPVEDVLLRVSAMVQAHPEIAELDCNPLIDSPHGATIVDARLRVAATEPPPPSPSVQA
jgi:hypothetical protein